MALTRLFKMRAGRPESDAPYLPQGNVNGVTVAMFVGKRQFWQEPARCFRSFEAGSQDFADIQALSAASQRDAEISDRAVQTRTAAAATRLARPYIVAKR